MKWSFAQVGLLIIAAFHVIQAVIGFIVEPSFATGPDAPTAQVLGMDYNGWHAVAGLALFAPGLVFAMRKSWSVLYLLIAAVAGALPGIWAFFSHQVAFVFTFPNNTTDAIVHLVTAAVMIAVAAIQIRIDGGLKNSLADLHREPQSTRKTGQSFTIRSRSPSGARRSTGKNGRAPGARSQVEVTTQDRGPVLGEVLNRFEARAVQLGRPPRKFHR